MADTENQGLLMLFAAECQAHLALLGAQADLLEDLARLPAAAATAARHAEAALAHGRIGATLHTLAGAARAVDLPDLEILCRSLESLESLESPQLAPDATLAAEYLAVLRATLALAPRLVANEHGVSGPGPRARNQMLQLVARCAALARAGADAGLACRAGT